MCNVHIAIDQCDRSEQPPNQPNSVSLLYMRIISTKGNELIVVRDALAWIWLNPKLSDFLFLCFVSRVFSFSLFALSVAACRCF